MFKVDKNSLEIIYFSFIRSKIEYGSILYMNAANIDLAKINKIHNEAIRITVGATKRCNLRLMCEEVNWHNPSCRRNIQALTLCF